MFPPGKRPRPGRSGRSDPSEQDIRTPLAAICASYDPAEHQLPGPLLHGGPAELVGRYGLPHDGGYADACHLCDQARHALRGRFPEALTPDQMYGNGDALTGAGHD